jgi:tetratricopeptide (TPR) repeat protein
MKEICIFFCLLFISISADSQPQQQLNIRLLQAAENNQADSVKYWLEKGADVNYADSTGFVALHYGIMHFNQELCKYLIEKNANINGTNMLLLASMSGNLRACYLLYTKGLNLTDRIENKSYADWAREEGFLRVARFLEDPSSYSTAPTYHELKEKMLGAYTQNNLKLASEIGSYLYQSIQSELSETNPAFAEQLNVIARLYHISGLYEKAEPLFLQALKIGKKVLGENHPDYATSISNLALLYADLGVYEKAEPLLLQALKIRKEVLGENHPDYANSLNNLASLYQTKGLYEKAEPLLLQALKILEEVLGEDHEDYATSLNNLALSYKSQGLFEKAEPLYLQALKIRKEVLGENHPDYAESLSNLGGLFYIQGLLKKAELFNQQALKIRKEVLGENHPDYAMSLNNMAVLYDRQGLYKKAEPLLLECLKISKEVLGETHPDYANSIINIAELYRKQGKYEKAEPLYLQVLSIESKVLGENHPDYAKTLNSLAVLYYSIGLYEKAENLFLQALKTQKDILGETHLDYAATINNLALLYKIQGLYTKAEPLYLQAMKIRKNSLGESHPDYILSLNNLASLYLAQELYEKAELLYLKAIRITKEVLGENHPDNAVLLNNLSELYEMLGQYKKAETFLLQALKIYKEVLGEQHPNYATSLINLASLYQTQGLYKKTIPLYSLAFKIRKEILSENHPDYAASLFYLASLYQTQGLYEEAEPLYLQALKVQKEVLGDNHSDYGTSLIYLAIMYQAQGLYDKAEPIFIEVSKIFKEILGQNNTRYTSSLTNLASLYDNMGLYLKAEPLLNESSTIVQANAGSNFSFLSESEREQYWSSVKSNFEFYKSYTHRYYPKKPSISTFAYDNELFTKSVLLNTSREVQQSILNSNDTALIRSWNTMKDVRRRIHFLETQPKEKQFGLAELEEEANQLDKELTQKSQAYRQAQTEQQIKWQDVQAKLNEGEAAIEFSSFRYFNKQTTDSTMYCALVLKKGMEYPVMVPICEQKQLDSLFVGGNAAPNLLYASRGVTAEYKAQLPNGQKLYKLVWQPLEKELKDVKTVYYSPSGSLHQISFSALPTDSAHYLCDRYNLVQLSSTRQLATAAWQTKPAQISSTALFGGIKYDLEGQELAELQRSFPKNELEVSRGFTADSTRNAVSFGFLEGTKKEVESISANLNDNRIKTTLYTGINGNEESFKAMSNHSPSVLHLATHGFFFPDEQQKPDNLDRMISLGEQKFRYVPNPLRRSGLVMAGGNRAWKGEEPVPGMEDGILTAQEISEMNLLNTELVVMSACETGLGDIKGGEGVFGLQRAFKLAGAKTILMSLWKVPDAETSELMQSFYQKWLGGMDKREAFRLAQKEIKVKHQNEPYYWAGFVMVD